MVTCPNWSEDSFPVSDYKDNLIFWEMDVFLAESQKINTALVCLLNMKPSHWRLMEGNVPDYFLARSSDLLESPQVPWPEVTAPGQHILQHIIAHKV